MIDIHSHILFDIDDGAKTLGTSIEMCLDAADNNVDTIVLTPHFFDFNKIKSFESERNLKISELRRRLKKADIKTRLLRGAEVYLSDDVFFADSLDSLTINDSRYILCEFPLGPFDVKRVTKWTDDLIMRGYVPIIAHPERYVEFHRNHRIIDELIDREVVFQVNFDSLLGKNGPEPQGMAIDMVMRRIARVIASDAHDPGHRHNRFLEKIEELPEFITKDILRDCLIVSPKKIINNEDIN